jgi:hypothetical protein
MSLGKIDVKQYVQYVSIWFSLFFCGTGTWTQDLHLEQLQQSFFIMGFFEIGSYKLFAQTGFESLSSWSSREAMVNRNEPLAPLGLVQVLDQNPPT